MFPVTIHSIKKAFVAAKTGTATRPLTYHIGRTAWPTWSRSCEVSTQSGIPPGVTDTSAMIDVRGLNKYFGERHILKDIDFTGEAWRVCRHHRSERLRQEHAHPLHQLP